MAGDESEIEALQRMLDRIYRREKVAARHEVLREADVMEFPHEVRALFDLLPPGDYTRRRLVDQLNSAIVGHGLGRKLGTVE